MKYTLPQLNYHYQDLEPYIDAQTMEIHHTKHHQAYVDNLNKVLEKYPQLVDQPLDDLLGQIDQLEMTDADRMMLRNNGGGHVNHDFFWQLLDPNNRPDEKLKSEIMAKFSSVDSFKEQLTQIGMSRFGSGWAWLVRKGENGELAIYSTPNQDPPIMQGDTPIIGIDVWEHAYYLKYQNRRAEYLKNIWSAIKLI